MAWTNARGTEWESRLVNDLNLTTQLQPLTKVNDRCQATQDFLQVCRSNLTGGFREKWLASEDS